MQVRLLQSKAERDAGEKGGAYGLGIIKLYRPE